MRKNKWFLVPVLAILASGGLLLLIQGCNGKIAPLPDVLAPAPTPLPYGYITDFESGTTGINPHLPGASSGLFWRNTTYGGTSAAPNKVNTVFVVPNTVKDGVDNSNFAAHVFASLLATGIGNGYESDQLICPLYDANTRTYFDASAFSGVQFLINIEADDTNTVPVFQIAIDQTEPPPALQGAAGGTCLNGTQCNNHFQVNLLSYVTKGAGWQPVSLTWNQLSSAFGTITPPGLTNHLNRILFLQWQFSDNVLGTLPPIATTTDYWVDNVQFFP